jgi:alkylhydroperoxidase family enzyme
MAALDAVEWETCLLEPVRNPDAERLLRRELGVVPPGARYFLASSWLPRAVSAFSISRLPLRHLSPELAEMISLVVSQDNACRYCFNVTRAMLGILGFSETRIRRLEEDLGSGELTPRDRAALHFARRVSRATPRIDPSETASLRELGWSAAAIAEIATAVAVNVFFNRTATLPALPYESATELLDRPVVRMLKPLVRRFVLPRRTAQVEPLPDAARTAPFAPVYAALAGVPLGARLYRTIDACWRESSLGPRATGLVFAVVARGMGCTLSEGEAVRWLQSSGLSDDEIESALAHLTAPSLTPLERAAAALARDSIWPQPAALQRHARAVRPLFSGVQFVDLIGVAALANALCRLGVAVDLAPPATA